MLRYAITDGTFSADYAQRLAKDGVDFIQLRDKALPAADLLHRAATLLSALRGSGTRLLINGRADVALAAGAAGVHLTSHPDELSVTQVRTLFNNAGRGAPVLSVSCHTLGGVEQAARDEVDCILFGPVYEKRIHGLMVSGGVGLNALRAAAALAPGRVFALGGVTETNAAACVTAGAAGVAGIRMFG